MNTHVDIKHDSATLSEAQIMAKLGAPDVLPEGMFFPDTYVFAKGASDLAVLSRARGVMKKQLESAWAGRAPDLPMTDPYEALILASLVEKETGRAGDRTMIAAVFANRLRREMKLQTDPSVIYGMGERFDGNLRKKDLVTDTPFNTYTRLGLPPHPIAMPGLASLAAVMHPAQTDALYFVSRGDGTSEFSRTLVEHNRAVAKYQMPGSRRRALPETRQVHNAGRHRRRRQEHAYRRNRRFPARSRQGPRRHARARRHAARRETALGAAFADYAYRDRGAFDVRRAPRAHRAGDRAGARRGALGALGPLYRRHLCLPGSGQGNGGGQNRGARALGSGRPSTGPDHRVRCAGRGRAGAAAGQGASRPFRARGPGFLRAGPGRLSRARGRGAAQAAGRGRQQAFG